MAARVFYIFRDFGRQMTKKNISAFAASTAFFLFLSIIPMLIVICSIIPYTPLTEANLLAAVTELTPDAVDPLIVNIIYDVYDKSAGVLSVAAVAMVWSAAKGMMALIRGLNEIDGVDENRNYIVLRLVASFYTLVMLAVLLLSLGVMVFGNVIVSYITYKLPQVEVIFHSLMHFRFLFSWALITVGFNMIYTFIPNKKMRFRSQLPGAVFSSVVWSAFSWGFSVYVERVNNFSTYGNLATIVIIMLWLYMGIYILMIGAEMNRYFGPVYKFLFGFTRREKEGEP